MEFFDIRHPVRAPSPAAARVLDFLQQHDLATFANGTHPIAGDDFYVNIFAFDTDSAANRLWEAHRAFIDVHIVLTGAEWLGQQFLPDVQTGDYHPESDYLEIAPPAGEVNRFHLQAGYLAVFYPEDAHQTGVTLTGERAAIRKAVFKIALQGGGGDVEF